MSAPRNYTIEQCLEAGRAFLREEGRAPLAGELCAANNLPCINTIVRIFGGLIPFNALLTVGEYQPTSSESRLRQCLRCDRTFVSTHLHHRVCKRCKSDSDWTADSAWMSGVAVR